MEKYLYDKNLPLKSKIIIYKSTNCKIKVIYDPIPFLISHFSDIKSILKEKNMTKILYFNVYKVHMILYEKDEIIKLNDESDNDLSFYYYLFLLIRAGEDIINYEFLIKFINLLYNKIKNKENKYYNFITFVIIIELINNYRNCNLYDESADDDSLSKLEKECREYIKNNINIFLDIKANITEINIYNKNLDEVYTDIITALIINNKLYDYDYCINIFNQLDLENIDVQFFCVEKLWNRILEVLNSNNDYIKINAINNFDDFNDMNKVNFYNLLFKFILKSSFYIYHIPFLFQMHKKAIEILKNQEYITFTISNTILIERQEYVIKRLIDLDFYYIKFYLDKKKSTKSGNVTIMSNILTNSRCIFDVAIEIKKNPKISKIECLYEHEKSITLEEMKKLQEKNIENDNTLNLNFKLFLNCLSMLKNIIENQKNTLQFNFNFKLFFDFKKKLTNDNKNNIYNISVEYSVREHPFFQIDATLSDENILIKKPNEFLGLISLISKLNYQNTTEISATIKSISFGIDSNYSVASNFEDIEDFKIIQLDKIIYIHENSVKFFLELKNGYFFSIGNSGKMVLFNQNFKKLLEKNNLDDIIYYVSEIYSEGKNIELVACYGTNIYTIIINKTNLEVETRKYQIPDIKILYCEKFKKNEYVIAGISGAMRIIDMFNDELEEKKINTLLNFSIKIGLVIDNECVVLISNDLIPKGENKLAICNLSRNKVEYIIQNYSFNLSENSLYFINRDNISNILLCAVKKYKSGQKNGILVIDMDSTREGKIKYNFFTTGNFEPYCFCQIFESKYIMVGGYDLNKRIGVIRLYKINKNFNEFKYIQDIEIIVEVDNNFNGFIMPINNILQIEETGKIIITCIDGGIYLFNKPNLDHYNYNFKR